MLVDIWPTIKADVAALGERGFVPIPEGSEIEPEFMEKKEMTQTLVNNEAN